MGLFHAANMGDLCRNKIATALTTSAESSVRMGFVELKSVEVASNNNGTKMRSQVTMLATDLVNSATEL